MIFRKDDGPIDGKKVNLLLIEIRKGNSEYLESEIDSLIKKSNWRKLKPSKLSTIIVYVFALLIILANFRTPFFILIGWLMMMVPVCGWSLAEAGYKSYNKLKFILSQQESKEKI